MKNKTILLTSLLVTLFGCGINNSGNPNVVTTSSPTILISPSVAYSIMPSSTPSPDVSSTPTPLPSVIISPSATPSPIDGNNYNCSTKEKESNPKLTFPIDVVVTKDGKSVYALATNDIRDKTLIYKIKDGKSSVLRNENGCPTMYKSTGGLEIDGNDNLYVTSYNLKDITSKQYGELGQRILTVMDQQKIIKIVGESKQEVYFNKKYTYPNNLDFFEPHYIENLYVSKKDNLVYFSVDYGSESSRDSISRVKSYDQLEELYVKRDVGGYIPSFVVEDNKLNFGLNFLDLSLIKYDINHDYIYHNYFYTPPLTAPSKGEIASREIRMNSKGETIRTYDTLNKIDKVVPNLGVVSLAGTGNAGYKDGFGSQAEFNSPIGLDIDDQDNIYVADSGNNAIRKISPIGVVTTVYKESN